MENLSSEPASSLQKIAIFASGSGSNAEQIISYFQSNKQVEVAVILSNKADAFVLERAKKFGIPTKVFDRPTFRKTENVLQTLQQHKIDLVVLAGFLWLIPSYLVKAFPNRIINIHPALLPKYGGKGMYGMHVHQAVIDAGEKESGITIHYVNEEYDEGQIIFQATCPLNKDETPETLAEKIHTLEHAHFPQVIDDVLSRSGRLERIRSDPQ